jgi:lipopolysaccharide transport system permease protein
MSQNNTAAEIIYTSESKLRTPFLLVKNMWSDLKASRELSRRLFIRDISALYRQSMFGILWAFAPPLITSLIFILLQSRQIINFGQTDIPYPVYVLVSTLLWQLFTDGLNSPLKSVTAAKTLLVRVNFPREALLISSFYMVLFNMLIKLGLLTIILLIFQIEFTWGILLSLFPIVMLILLGLCIGILITPIGMLYTDIGSALPIITQLLFFLTPVVYPPPESFPLSLIVVINPVSPLLIAAREFLVFGAISNVLPLIVVSCLTVLFLFFSWIIYRIALPIIIERLSA